MKLKTELGEEAKTEIPIDEGEDISRVPKHIIIFHYIYMRLEALKQGYFSGIRPVIGLDGCHLKTSMGGQMLCVVARDGNENMFPLAYAIVDIECKESWLWFLGILFEDFGHPNETGWVFISDR